MDLNDHPDLENPILIAGWPGMGLVAYKSVSYLIEHLEARPLAEFDIQDLYQVRGVTVNNGMVEHLEIPKGSAYFHKGNGNGSDLLLFLGDEQPVAGKELYLSREILEMARRLGCREVFTFAAMVTGISHHAISKVWGCTNRSDLLEKMKRHDILPMSDGQISGLNGLLVGVASSFGMAANCLLGELPYYATQIAYYPASCAVLEKFADLTGVKLNLDSLRQQCKTTQIEIDTYIEHIKREASRKREESPASEEPSESLKGEEEEEEEEEDIMN
jgi:proteasome assembly chaperone (PAC2) family protein